MGREVDKMSWKLTFSAAIIALFSTLSGSFSEAEAGNRGWWLCWIPAVSDGAHECVRLPDNWRIRGVRRPYCQHWIWRCTRARVDFRVNRSNVRDLSRYAKISSLGYGAYASVHTRRYAN